MPVILFVCNANLFRSVLAEASFTAKLQTKGNAPGWVVRSAGIWTQPGLPPLKEAVVFAKSKGWELSANRSREVNPKLLEESDLIIVMTRSQQEAIGLEFPQVKRRLFLISEICTHQTFDVRDPLEDPLVGWEEVGREIDSLITSGFDNICNLAVRAEAKYHLRSET
jgi:protein-tyrosine phosphatase